MEIECYEKKKREVKGREKELKTNNSLGKQLKERHEERKTKKRKN